MKGDDYDVQAYLDDLFKRCVDKWGSLSQFLMVVEELNELSVEILHMLRANKKPEMIKVFKELVDVLFMLDQFMYMLDIGDLVLRNLRDKKVEYVETLLLEDQG